MPKKWDCSLAVSPFKQYAIAIKIDGFKEFKKKIQCQTQPFFLPEKGLKFVWAQKKKQDISWQVEKEWHKFWISE